MFYFEQINGQKILKSTLISEITAFFTTRSVISLKNLELHCPIVKPEQTHGDNIEIVDNRLEYPNTDGLILADTEKAICLKFADCTPLIFYDTENKIGAISHAGWRGTALKIGVKTVEKMNLKFGSKVDNLKVLIGPTISLCCYEVGLEVKEKLLNTVKNTDNLFNCNFIDLKGINARQLQEIGVKNIDIAPYCTVCNNDLFYSYRKEKGTLHRHYAIIKLK